MTDSIPEGDPDRPVALIGSSGMLAQAVSRQAPDRYQVHPFDLPGLDITDRSLVFDVLQPLRPAVILNCAAFTDVDRCEAEEEHAIRVNGDGPGYLAEAARAVDAILVHVSTDFVFDGTAAGRPYTESDLPNPLSAYGRSKLQGEQAIAASGLDRYFILRTGWLYGPGGHNFVETVLDLAAQDGEVKVVDDQVGSPTYTRDLAEAIFRLLDSPAAAYGLYHVTGAGHCSRHRFAEAILGRRVTVAKSADFPRPAARPAWSVLCCDKFRRAAGWSPPPWEDGLRRYLQDRARMGSGTKEIL